MSNVTNKREYLVEVNNLKQYFPMLPAFYFSSILWISLAAIPILLPED